MKKIVITLVAVVMFSSGFFSAKAAEKNTTSNAVTTFYGKYEVKEEPEDNSNLSGNMPNDSNNHSNTGQTGNGNSSNDFGYDTSGSNGSSDSDGKVIPHTGNTPYIREQVLGYSLLISLFFIPIIRQKKEF